MNNPYIEVLELEDVIATSEEACPPVCKDVCSSVCKPVCGAVCDIDCVPLE